MKHFFLLSLILISTIVVFFPTINTYFSQDDWVFLSHVYKRPWIDVFRYYPEAFYRPIGQQLFFKIGSFFFGLNPVGYHTLALGVHAVNTILLWKVLNLFHRHSEQSAATSRNLAKRFILILFYSLHPVHLIALNWLTQVDIEVAATFTLLTILTFEKHFLSSVVTFIVALLSHETAAMLPVMLMLKGPSFRTEGRSFRSRWIVLFFVAITILLAKYLMNPFPFRSDYSLGFHPIQLFSTTKWYMLRALFLPEGIRALPSPVPILSVLSAGLLILLFRWQLLRALLVFILGLVPVLLFSQHTFSVYAILPMLWMVLSLGSVFLSHPVIPSPFGKLRAGSAEGSSVSESFFMTWFHPKIIFITIIILVITSYSISRSVLPPHWTTTRGEISRKLTDEFLKRPGPADAGPGLDKLPDASEPSFASMMGRQFEVLSR